jgi:hypothetical protein
MSMAKKAKKKAKAKAKNIATAPAKWDTHSWSFDGPSIVGFVGPPPAGCKNIFTLQALAFPASPSRVYQLIAAQPIDVTDFWKDAKLLPQGGDKLKMGFRKFRSPPGSPQEIAERQARYDKTVKKVSRNPFKYERLAGLQPFVTPQGQIFIPITFYQAEKAHTDGSKAILVVLFELPPGSGGGSAIVGNG